MKCPTCGHSAKPKASKSTKPHKYATCFATHDEHCYCVVCAPAKIEAGRIEHARLLKVGLVETATLDKPAHFDKQAAIAALEYCACGHGSSAHMEDELENLLACSECSCDHFHYQKDEKVAA